MILRRLQQEKGADCSDRLEYRRRPPHYVGDTVIAFATLFLGLVLGVQTVEVMASQDVARVELLLDGRPVAAIEHPPWRTVVDLGTALEPKILEAVGRDGRGREIARSTQRLNLPRPPAELELLLEPGEEGRGSVARLSWDSIAGQTEPTIRAWFDGAELPVVDTRRLELPAHDPRQLHFLRVEATFTEHLGTVAERVLGGTWADQLSAQLTAVPVHVSGNAELPAARQLDDWLTVDGKGAPVLAVDDGPDDLIVVRDLSAQPLLDGLASLDRSVSFAFRSGSVRQSPSLRYVAPLKGDQRLRFLAPYARQVADTHHTTSLFEPSEAFTAHDGGLYWLLTRVRTTTSPPEGQRLADAVAAAGMMAAGGSRPRAVLLILGPDAVDRSGLDPETVRGYLESLRVPMVVWSLGGAGTPSWGPTEAIESLTSLERATKAVRRLLDRQRILWIEGIHLPQRIELSARAAESVHLGL
jgi:hypothetical protein